MAFGRYEDTRPIVGMTGRWIRYAERASENTKKVGRLVSPQLLKAKNEFDSPIV
jgi:hypothetical protein